MQINIKNTAGPVGAVTKCGNVRVRKTVFTVVLIIGVLVIFAAFISFIALSATAGRGFGSRMQYIFIPFAVFGACAVTMPFLFTMRARYSQLVALADRIAAKDATVIASLAVQQTVPAFEAMKITVGSLLKGGALPGYEIVGEVVAKTSRQKRCMTSSSRSRSRPPRLSAWQRSRRRLSRAIAPPAALP